MDFISFHIKIFVDVSDGKEVVIGLSLGILSLAGGFASQLVCLPLRPLGLPGVVGRGGGGVMFIITAYNL